MNARNARVPWTVMTRRAKSPSVSAYLERSRDRRSAIKRSGELVEQNLRRASAALRRGADGARSKPAA
jgi:hypothetical protein